MTLEPITREEQFLNSTAIGELTNIVPVTREEMFLAKAGGKDIEIPKPVTRKEMFLKEIAENRGGGGDAVASAIIDRSITEIRDENVTEIGQYAFFECKALTKAIFPNATSIERAAFGFCTSLTKVDVKTLPLYSQNEKNDYSEYKYVLQFMGCTSLEAVIIRNPVPPYDWNTLVDYVAHTEWVGVLFDTGGHIYVPASVKNAYLESDDADVETLNMLFRAIEDYPDICGTTG